MSNEAPSPAYKQFHDGTLPSPLAMQIAARCWCDEATKSRAMDPTLAFAFAERVEVLLRAVEFAWTIICNAGGGDWEKETPDWQEAARKFRDEDFNAVTKL